MSLSGLSLLFYGWWSPKYLLLLLPFILFDFVLAKSISKWRERNTAYAKILLSIGVVLNLGALCYFKYANFFVNNINTLFGADYFLAGIVLPIGISFYTFQKVAFLIDVYYGKVRTFKLLDYALFVTFFPQLIAGPIVHHSEMMPQFNRTDPIPPNYYPLGLTFFSIGLAKKVLLADTAALYASPHFNAVANGATIDLITAWGAALAYTAQLYFDFSAYSDMAIGIGLLFGIRLPINFNSPYQAASIVEFWNRWHITLSRFLRDYLYIPLGGNRKGPRRRYINLMLTMVLGGFWHGAGWTFVIWGLLHGFYLVVNQGWTRLCTLWRLTGQNRVKRKAYQLLTFFAVVVAWVFFRSADLPTAGNILSSMAGLHGMNKEVLSGEGGMAFLVASTLLLFSFYAPNTQQVTGYIGPEGAYASTADLYKAETVIWGPTPRWAIATGILFALSLMAFSGVSEFIYFQF